MKIASIIISSTVALTVGMFLGMEIAPVKQPLPFPDSSAQMTLLVDSLISEWIGERTATPEILTADMNENNGRFRYGFVDQEVRTLADTIEARYGVPHSVTLAQFVLESGFGLRNLNAENYFGHTFPMRYAKPATSFVVRDTREFVDGKWIWRRRQFAAYRNIEHCFDAHGRLLAAVYASAFTFRNDPMKFAESISKRYATDPTYATKLKTIIRRYNLEN